MFKKSNCFIIVVIFILTLCINNSAYAQKSFFDDMYIKSDSNLESIDFYPKELGNNKYISFSKCKTYKLNQDMLDYVNHFKNKIEGTIKSIYNCSRKAYYISQDCPELSISVNEYHKRLDEMFGPAIIQYLSLIKDNPDYEQFNPDKIFEASDASWLKIIEKRKEPSRSELEKSLPYLFGNKFEIDVAEKTIKNLILEHNYCFDIFALRLLMLHPSILNRDIDYIISKLSNKTPHKFNFENSRINWNFVRPFQFHLIKSNINSEEFYMSFESPVDCISGIWQVYPIYEDISNITKKEYLETLRKNDDYLSIIVNGKPSSANIITFQEIDNKPVLVVENNISITDNSTFKNGIQRTYIFIEGQFTFEFKFIVKAKNENEASEAMKKNIPLFEALVKANKTEPDKSEN